VERLTETVHSLLSERLKPGDVAVDATAGNGHDTLFLARTVGRSGRVHAFDLQEMAIEKTRQRLASAGCENVVFHQADHATMASEIPAEHQGRIAAVVFNLGYLPGSDKKSITQTHSTCAAITQGLEFLKPGGMMTVLAYPGHPGGLEEAQAVERLLQTLPADEFTVQRHLSDQGQGPRLFVVTRRETSVI
jgi:predicted methyltransferase